MNYEITDEQFREIMKNHIINLTNRLYSAEIAIDTLLEMNMNRMEETDKENWKSEFNTKYNEKIQKVNEDLTRQVEQNKQAFEASIEKEDLIVTPGGSADKIVSSAR